MSDYADCLGVVTIQNCQENLEKKRTVSVFFFIARALREFRSFTSRSPVEVKKKEACESQLNPTRWKPLEAVIFARSTQQQLLRSEATLVSNGLDKYTHSYKVSVISSY